MLEMTKQLTGRHKLSPWWKFWDSSYMEISDDGKTIDFRTNKIPEIRNRWRTVFLSDIEDRTIISIVEYYVINGEVVDIPVDRLDKIEYYIKQTKDILFKLLNIGKFQQVDHKSKYIIYPKINGQIVELEL